MATALVDPGPASYAARASQGHIGRARALATDEATRTRRREVVGLPAGLVSLGAAMRAATGLAERAKAEAEALLAAEGIAAAPEARLLRRRLPNAPTRSASP